MGRHSKNNTSHSIFTYYERKMVKGVGTFKERLGTHAQRQFELCWLCLRTARKPVCSPQGYLYCRECIVLNLADQRRELEDKRKTWLLQQAEKKKEAELREAAKAEGIVRKFIETESGVSSYLKEKPAEETKAQKRAHCFWVPENTPGTEENKAVAFPKSVCACPISGAPLRLKDLVEVKPESMEPDEDSAKWVCAISKKLISFQKAVVIKPTGQLVLAEYVDKFVLGKKGFCGKREITKSDILPIIPGGTGFSAHNNVEAERFRPVLR